MNSTAEKTAALLWLVMATGIILLLAGCAEIIGDYCLIFPDADACSGLWR